MPVAIPVISGTIPADAAASNNSLVQRDSAGGATVVAIVAATANLAAAAYSASHTVSATESILNGDATGGAVVFTLPFASAFPGRLVIAKKIDVSGNAVSLTPQSPDTIDGASSKSTTSQWGILRGYSNGTNWFTW